MISSRFTLFRPLEAATGSDPAIEERAAHLFHEQYHANCKRTDRLFVGLMVVQWVFAVTVAMILAPWTYVGNVRHVNPHVWLAIFLGGGLTGLTAYIATVAPGKRLTRYVIAVAQMMFSSLLIQITGGRIETHFHVFGSLAFLAIYRDWTVLIPATVVVAVDHFVRGTWYPASVFGVSTASPWRWVEHAGWVVFEDVFLVIACVRSVREMQTNALNTATLEERNTELKTRTVEREEALRLKRSVLENSLDAVISSDHVGIITEWNSQAEATFGWSHSEAVGRNLVELIIPASFRGAHIEGMRHYRETDVGAILNQRIEVVALHKDGREFPLELTVTPIRSGPHATFCAFARDITERVSAAEALRKDRDEAAAANRAKSTFLAHMSHEIRTPLNGILGYADLLLRKGEQLPRDERREHLETIRHSGTHLLELINDVLDLSKIEADQLEVDRILCSPHETIAQVVSVLRVRAQEKGLELDCRWEGKVPEFIVTDPHRMRQLLMNLVGNAIKFTSVGHVNITARLVPTDERYLLEIQVSDTGPGIAADSQQKIFEPFVQADNSVTREFGGTGLGLAICRRIVQMLGGTLTLESEPGRGSVFTFTLDPGRLEGVRLLDGPAAEIIRPITPTSIETVQLGGSRVLVVDDGVANRRLLEIVLRDAGAQVVTAENGQVAVDMALAARDAGEPFDVILMDMQMPVLDGYSATRKLRELDFTAPIFALTAHAMKGDEALCQEHGCTGYLTKPIDTENLIATVASALTPRSRTVAPSKKPALIQGRVAHSDAMEEVLHLFHEELLGRVDELSTAIAEGDFTTVARTAHWLKGSAGSMGYDRFTAPAATLEKTAHEANASQCELLIDEITQLVDEIQSDTTYAVENSCSPSGLVAENVEPTEPVNIPVAGSEAAASRILVVDDEPFNLRMTSVLLNQAGYQNVFTQAKPGLTLQTILVEQPHLVLLDLHMPGMDGFEVLDMIRHAPGYETLPVVMLTASHDKEHRRRALQLGVTDFLTKPIDLAELAPRVRNALTVKQHEDRLKMHAQLLETQVQERTEELERARRNAVYCLARAAEFRDDETGRHVIRVGRYAGIIAEALGWQPEAVRMIEEAAQLHDIGKIGISDAILLKPGKLSPEEYLLMQKHCGFGKSLFECFDESEWQAVRQHAEIGNRILSVDGAPLMEMASIIALTHHEKYDGTGYPLGLKGEDIPLLGRIVAVADVFDALSSKRTYKPAFPVDRCLEIMMEGRGKHFDPDLLDLFISCREQVLSIQIAHADVN